ncbi:MAG: class I SAM-dependent methyltransferase [Candidatus Poribacteria bacterium]
MNRNFIKQEIISLYDDLAYLGKFPDGTYLHKTFQSIINDQFSSRKELKILDAGGGAGYFSLSLAELGHNVTLLDLSIEAIKTAQKRNFEKRYDINLLQGDVENLPFADNSFDAIVCVFVFSHLNEPMIVISHFKRVLRPSGQMIISFENKYWHIIAQSLIEKYSNALSLLKNDTPIIKAYDILPPVRLYSVSEIKKMIFDLDMKIVFFKGFRYLTSFQEYLKGIGTTDTERLMFNNKEALELENTLMENDEILPIARHFIICCEKQ